MLYSATLDATKIEQWLHISIINEFPSPFLKVLRNKSSINGMRYSSTKYDDTSDDKLLPADIFDEGSGVSLVS